MTKYQDYSLSKFLDVLSQKSPVPGGGSAAAFVAALGASLFSMVANFSLKETLPKKSQKNILRILNQSERLRKRFLELVDLDALDYAEVVSARCGTRRQKIAAVKKARKVPREICRLSYLAVDLSYGLVKDGNKNLLSDVVVALEMFLAAFNSSIALLREY